MHFDEKIRECQEWKKLMKGRALEQGQCNTEEYSLIKASFFSRRQPFRVLSRLRASVLGLGPSMCKGLSTPC